jgi:hypothetical protein
VSSDNWILLKALIKLGFVRSFVRYTSDNLDMKDNADLLDYLCSKTLSFLSPLGRLFPIRTLFNKIMKTSPDMAGGKSIITK